MSTSQMEQRGMSVSMLVRVSVRMSVLRKFGRAADVLSRAGRWEGSMDE